MNANSGPPSRASGAESRWLRAVASGADESTWPAAAGLDGRRLLALATRHRLAPRIGGRLARASAAGPAGAENFARAWRIGLGEDALAGDVLGAIGEKALARGLPCVALKGADLARRVYGAGERPGADIDLLTVPERLADAAAVLESCGFVCDHPDPEFARRHWFAVTFRSAARERIQVDLHWALGPRWRTRWDLSSVLSRCEALPGAPGIQRLSAGDLAAHLALHAVAFHGAAVDWLRWLDVWLLVASDPAQAAAHEARAREVGGAVAWAAARRRSRVLFAPPGYDAMKCGWRARWAAGLGEFLEDRAPSRIGRWSVGALAVDRPTDLLRAAGVVALRVAGASRGSR